MFFRIFLTAILALSFFSLNQQQAEAKFFLLNALEKVNNSLQTFNNTLGTSNADTTNVEPTAVSATKADRWILIDKTSDYDLYAERKSLEASGTAQNREVSGWFKREYTPIGSQKLGGYTNAVKPDTVKYSIFRMTFYTNRIRYYGSGAKYYDVHGNLLYDGQLEIPSYMIPVYITPESYEEKLKDKMFRMFGWDY